MAAAQHILQKSVWDTGDFEVMGWHDCSIHGINFVAAHWELAFDIDYILEWVKAENEPIPSSNFWISPATLVFHEVNGIKTANEIWTGFPLTPVIMNVRFSKEGNDNLAGFPRKWVIEFEHGEMEFHSSGFTQFIRTSPILQDGQNLSLEQRGGVSFTRPTKIL